MPLSAAFAVFCPMCLPFAGLSAGNFALNPDETPQKERPFVGFHPFMHPACASWLFDNTSDVEGLHVSSSTNMLTRGRTAACGDRHAGEIAGRPDG